MCPDRVGDRLETLRLAERWLPQIGHRVCSRVLVAVQDGMTAADVQPFCHSPRVGIFLGGSTAWKLETMPRWGRWCAERGVYFHVARVNTIRRIRMAAEAGADSFDGSSPVQFPSTLPKLDRARREGTLYGPAFVDPPADYEAAARTVELELPTYRDDEEVTMDVGALRALLRKAKT